MKKILIITGRYLPGYKDGGPVRTIKNLTDMLSDKYHFSIMCSDRDHGDGNRYEGIITGIHDKNTVGNATVYYMDNGKYSLSDIKTLAKEHDIVYVCGIYNLYAIKAMMLHRIGMINSPFVIAPMGSFSKGALSLKSKKKQIFLSAIKFLGLINNAYFSVTSDVEKQELKEALNSKKEIVRDDKCFVAEDPQRKPENHLSNKTYRKNNKLNIVFLSRITEKKNLLGAIEILSKVRCEVLFHIYGTMEDKFYFSKCEEMLRKLPDNIEWKYMGEAPSEDVPDILSEYDVFLFPTLGENFGHVISESLSAGTIPVISDTTPWLDFAENNCGFVFSLNSLEKFSDCIEKMSDMSEDELNQISVNAYNYYKEKYECTLVNNGYSNMFKSLIKDA